ncbi:hypothetical protein SKAU_G00204810 [Synaphobranchus kaupii]|uniref:TGF-beta family profile domain-containing protein n=1 Tax=Synaphobranchus kaupii TaxID=118154 RepID=A0A9Q1FG67_SYNKA|nr:hypothetical protein SKAU_G00204810 [Synaphobranchus kaupii]
MRLWKWGTITLILCTAALSGLFSSIMLPTGPPHHRLYWGPASQKQSSPSASSSSPPSSAPNSLSSSSLLRRRGQVRAVRAVDGFRSLLTEFNYMFQSFTETELKQVIGTLLDRKWRRDKARRTKRARKGRKLCSLREVEVSVTQLGLGYESEETVLFRYCSGRCAKRRRTYDLALQSVQSAGLLKGPSRHTPCCRPLHYEQDFSFLGNNDKYYTIQELSAQECGCV